MLFFYGINIKSPQHDTLSITKKVKKINKQTHRSSRSRVDRGYRVTTKALTNPCNAT